MWPPPLPLLALLLLAGATNAACPGGCHCVSKTAHCHSFLPNGTEIFDDTIRSVFVRNITLDALNDLLSTLAASNVNELTITRSEIDTPNDTLSELYELVNVTVISLPYNNLTQIPSLLNNATCLRTLDISSNNIKKLQAQCFNTLRTLEVLNVSANVLTVVEKGSFEGLPNLRYLDLSQNNLAELAPGALTPLAALQHLNLSRNRLETLTEAGLGGLRLLRQLDVSWNRLARVAVAGLRLPRLARLLLAGNPRLGDARVLLGAGRRLQAVDASRSGLRHVPAALTHSIRTLRLAGNSIRAVSCGDLDSYPLLQLLDFSSNALEAVEDDALGRLESLSVLYLSDNKIRGIPRSLPEKLAVLHLEHNSVENVSRDDLDGLEALEVLLLNDNKIKTIQAGAFAKTLSLVTLDLSRNPINLLEPGSLSGPTGLQVLRMASVGTPAPAKEASFPLSSPERLLSLCLSESPALARQLLADTAALAAARELQELDLSNNGLEFIRSDLLHFLPQLRSLHLRGNSLNCSGLQWLATWMRRQDQPEYREVLCADIWGTPLVDLQSVNQIEEETTTIASTTTSLNSTNNKDSEDIISVLYMNDGVRSTEDNVIASTPVANFTGVEGGEAARLAWERRGWLLHPGMIVAGASALGAAGALVAFLAARSGRRRRREALVRPEDIEVASLPSVTELW